MYRQEERYPPRLPIWLCFATSQDDARPAEALRFQTRSSYGWQSAKHCSYPQDLGFRFDGVVSLQSLRLLSHETKISSFVDVFVAEPTAEELRGGVCVPYESATFVRLGYVRFSRNDTTDGCARELKTVGVGRQCVYLKLRFHRPHRNGYNVFQQVGLAAMTAHGNAIRHLVHPAAIGNLNAIPVGEVSEIPLDEMMPLTSEEANAANYDAVPGTAAEIEKLKQWKAHAVAEEDYDLAEKLKSQIEALEKNEPKIAALEAQKRAAVQAEDFARAKQLKRQIAALRNCAAPEDAEWRSSDNNNGLPTRTTNEQQQQRATRDESSNNDSDHKSRRAEDASAPRQQQQAPSAAKGAQPARALPLVAGKSGTSSAVDGYDEVTVGGKGFYDFENVKDPFNSPEGVDAGLGEVRTSPSWETEVPVSGGDSVWERQLNTAIAGFITDKSTPTPLLGDAAQDGKAYERDLGPYCTACLLAKRGQLREAAVRGVVSKSGYRALSTHTATAADTLLLYLAAQGRGVSDPVAGVVFAACEAIVRIVAGKLGDATPSSAGGMPPQLAPAVSKLSPDLVGRLGDANARVRENVEGAIVAIARSPVGPDKLTALLLVDPDKMSKKAASYRAHLGRVNLLSSFVDAYGVRGDGGRGGGSASPHALDTRQVVEQAVLPSLQHASSEVREAAAKLFAKLLMRDGAAARPYLAPLKVAQQSMMEDQLRLLADSGGAPSPRGWGPPPHSNSQEPSQLPSPTSPRPPASLSQAGGNNDRTSHSSNNSSPQTPHRRQQQQQRGSTHSSPRRSPATDLESDVQSVHRSNVYKSNAERRPSNTLLPQEMTSSRAEQEFRASHTCQFCGEFNRHFTESSLDVHYVSNCPMLCPCPLCDQVTEICTLQHHLVTECEVRQLVRECPRCREAVRAEDFKQHVAAKNCIEALPAYSVCPLCHDRLKEGMDGWRRHLATAPGCINNPRMYDGSGPRMQ